MSIVLDGHSHKGKVKEANEDHFSIIRPDHHGRPYIVMVTDGVGGRAAGEMASFLAIRIIAEEIKSKILTTENIKTTAISAIEKANNNIYNSSIERPELFGMCTTIVMGIILGDYIHVFSVGDSRAYLINKKDEFKQITTDHTWIHEMLSVGKIEENEVKNHPSRHRITRAIGISEKINPDYFCIPFEDTKYMLFCTDGLTEHVLDKQIEKTIKKYKNPKTSAEKLVSAALSKGGSDNVTVVVAKFPN